MRLVQLELGKVGGRGTANGSDDLVGGAYPTQTVGEFMQRPVRPGQRVSDRSARRDRRPYAARIVVGHAGAMSGVLDQPQRITPPAQRHRRTAHDGAVARGPTARLLPYGDRRLSSASARSGSRQYLIRLSAYPPAALRGPADQSAQVSVRVERFGLEQALGQLDRLRHIIIPRLVYLTRRDVADAIRQQRADPMRRVTFEGPAQGVADSVPEERALIAFPGHVVGQWPCGGVEKAQERFHRCASDPQFT